MTPSSYPKPVIGIFIILIAGVVYSLAAQKNTFNAKKNNQGNESAQSVDSSTELADQADLESKTFENRNGLPVSYSRASWRNHSSLKEMVEKADIVIIGTAERRLNDNEAVNRDVPGFLPMTRTVLGVEQVLKGTLAQGSKIVVTQAGGRMSMANRIKELKDLSPAPLPSEAGQSDQENQKYIEEARRQQELELQNTPAELWMELSDDPLFQYREQSFLFLLKTENDLYYSMGPDGRYRIDQSNRLFSMDKERPISKPFSGKPVEELMSAVQSLF